MERTIQYSDNNLIIQQVLSKFSFSLLFMTIGMIVGALLVPPGVAALMPIVCLFALLGAFIVRRNKREDGQFTLSMGFV